MQRNIINLAKRYYVNPLIVLLTRDVKNLSIIKPFVSEKKQKQQGDICS